MPENTTAAQTPPVAQAPQPAPAAQTPAPKKSSSKLPLLALLALLVVGVVAVGAYLFLSLGKNTAVKVTTAPATPAKAIRIGLSMDTLKELRWTKDRDLMTQKAKGMGATVITLVANGDDNTQIAQIENLIAQKVNVVIVIAHNAKALSGVVDEAHKAGIKVIGYDRMILDSNLDLYISFDSVKVGKFAAQYVMAAVPKTVAVPNVAFVGGSPTDNNATLVKEGAMSVLDPLVKAGKAKLVFDQFTTNWDPDVAYANLKKFLDGGGKVDAVVASNDGTGMGSIQSLKEHGLSGKVPVSGQDAELAAVKRLIDGTQTVTMYKPIAALANQAVESAIAFANGKAPKTTGVMNNGKIDVPSYLIDPIPVTKDTIKETVIKDGFYTNQEVYGQ